MTSVSNDAAERDPAPATLYQPDSKALASLACSTSMVIATLLTVPDAVGILPHTTDIVSWMLQLIGIWLVAAVLWFVGFTFILYVVRVIVGGVEVSDQTIKMWRFSRPIALSQVETVSVEPQRFFSALFRLQTVARRLTIFARKKGLDGKTRPVPYYLPSFFFDPEKFEALCKDIFQRRYKFTPDSIDVFVTESTSFMKLQKTFGRLIWQRIVISVFIASFLGFWLYKKAVAIYAYNSGNIAMSRFDYREAQRLYEWSIATDPSFAAGWNNLGNAQLHLNHASDAAKSWERAIFMKPDFVEPKISLSYLAMGRADYTKARELIESALNNNPLNPYALLNRADIEMSMGQVRYAMRDARMVMSQEPDPTSSLFLTASCILARGKVLVGEAEQAQDILRSLPPLNAQTLANQSNQRLRLVVSGETCLALHNVEEARKFFNAAIKISPNNVDAIVGVASVDLLEGNFDAARKKIEQAITIVPNSAWPRLLRARVDFEQGNREAAEKQLTSILTSKNLDGASLVEAGSLFLAMNHLDRAAFCAQRALQIDAKDKGAKRLLATITAEEQKTTRQ